MTGTAPDLSKLRINRDVTPPGVKTALRRNLILLGIAGLIVAGVIIYARQSNIPVVRVALVSSSTSGSTASAGNAGTSVTANGYVVARTKAAVSAKVAGRLAFRPVSEGSRVNAGDIIARLDNADYQAQVSQAEANVSSAVASVLEATADRDQLVREATRQRDIRAQNPNLVSQQELDQAQSKAAQAEARLNAAKSRKEAADAGLRLAQANLENTVIRAPFTGTVLRVEAEVGEVVAPSVGGGLTRGAVVTMADFSTLEVEVDVNEAYIARVKGGQRARITLDAYPDTSFRGEVRQVVPTADRQKATVQVKVSILDHDPRILPEMGAKVDFLEPERPRAAPAAANAPVEAPRLRVAADAIRQEAGVSVAWIVQEGRLVRRVIQAGPVSGGFREVQSGLSGGEQLLVSGVETPREGMRVKVGN